MMIPVLQSRWQLEGTTLNYYGLRNYPCTLRRKIKLRPKEAAIINAMDGQTFLKDIARKFPPTKKIRNLMAQGIVVDLCQVRGLPTSLDSAQYCVKCAANDFMLPGLEFDAAGTCALCQGEEHLTGKLTTPLLTLTGQTLQARASKSRFDVALMYTGGKDSSFLLYYLAKVLKLRVLACTWVIPYMAPNVLANIQAAKDRLPNVEFVERTILPRDLDRMYKTSLELQGNTCLCPSLAYVIFYPLLVSERIPFIVSGVEEAQHKNMIYNGFIPLHVYELATSPLVHHILNFFRILTLRPPYKRGQLATITYLKQLTRKNSLLQKALGYNNEAVEHIHASFSAVPEILKPLKKALARSNRTGNIPTLVNIDMNSISPNQSYAWKDIKELLRKELDWQGTGKQDKGLHTSCIVEDGKDYSQFIRFRNMESMLIPFSPVELSAAVRAGNITRKQALAEQQTLAGFSLEPPPACRIMQQCDGRPCRE